MFLLLEQQLKHAAEGFRFRELVLVAHSNRWGVQVPLTQDDYRKSRAGRSGFSYIYPETIAALQTTIKQQHPDFFRARNSVVKHLDVGSWVTLRSCNFGYSRDGMYALYSIFGGRANLYALRGYLTFVQLEVGQGRRIETPEHAYDYLRKQGFIDRSQNVAAEIQRRTIRRLIRRNRGTLPIQFFFPHEDGYDKFEGFELVIASSPRGTGEFDHSVSYDEVIAELSTKRVTRTISLLKDLHPDYTFEGNVSVSSNGLHRWTLSGRYGGRKRELIIMRKSLPDGTGGVRRVLKLYSPVTAEQKLSSEWSYYGVPYDVPGCELQAQLDRFSIDDLTCLQDYVREKNIYQAVDSVLIEHAQRSIFRRHEFFDWWWQSKGDLETRDDPLFGLEDDEIRYWYPHPLGGLRENEMMDLAQHAHISHRGLSLWMDVKVSGERRPSFGQDLFAEERLPFAPDIPKIYNEADILSLNNNDLDPVDTNEKRHALLPDASFDTGSNRSRLDRWNNERFGRTRNRVDKDNPFLGSIRDVPIDPREVFLDLSDEDLGKAIAEVLAMLADSKSDPDYFQRRTQMPLSTTDKTLFVASVLLETAEWVKSFAPQAMIAFLASTSAILFPMELFVSAILAPFLLWSAISDEVKKSVEQHRLWGMRSGLKNVAKGLANLATQVQRGMDLKRPLALSNYVDDAQAAVSAEKFMLVHRRYLEGYDLTVHKCSELTNALLDQAGVELRSMLISIGLRRNQIDLILDSGVMDMQEYYSVILQGFAIWLQEEIEKFTSMPRPE